MEVHVPGDRLYVLLDVELNGFITWMEKGTSAVMAWTSGEKAEEYGIKTYPERPLSVCTVRKLMAETFVKQMLKAGIEYMLLDVRPELVDPAVDGFEKAEQRLMEDPIRHYAIIDLKKVKARLF